MYRMGVPWVQSPMERGRADDEKLDVLVEKSLAGLVPTSSSGRPRLATWHYPP